jgi:uncharacterized lipoprotein YmbA
MTVRRGTLLLLLSALAVAGCATSVQVRHYLLAPLEAAAPQGREPALAVGPVRLPDYLLRKEFVRRVGGQELQYVPDRRWAEPLDSGIQRVTMANLAALLDTTRVQRFPGVLPEPDAYRVALQVRRFDVEGGALVALIDWALFRGVAGQPLVEGSFDGRAAVDSGEGAAVAAGFSELLAAMAREVAVALADESP